MRLWRIVEDAIDRLTGDRSSTTVPVMDGPLQPNNIIEKGDRLSCIEAADNLVRDSRNDVWLSSKRELYKMSSKSGPVLQREFDQPVTCLAASPKGALAIGLDGSGVLVIGGRHDGQMIAHDGLRCPTAILFDKEDRLFVTNGSGNRTAADWQRDLLSVACCGSVAEVRLDTAAVRNLVSGLGFPAGIVNSTTREDHLVVTEAWRHRLLSVHKSTGRIEEALTELPAYPGRLVPSSSGGYWLCCFATRSPLQEFVLREHRYRKRMMAEIEPAFWMAPALSSGHSFLEPLQAGGVIRLGVHKPWAPSRSYGLVIRLDGALQPVWSAHSRADGKRHGITSALEVDRDLWLTSKGNGEILSLKGLAQTPDQLALREDI